MRALAFTVLLFVNLLLVAAQAQPGLQGLLLRNSTGIEVRELYVSPHNTQDWEEDVLGGNTLRNGQSVQVKFPRRERITEWDIKIVDNEGESLEWTKLDLSEISRVTLYLRNGQAYADIR